MYSFNTYLLSVLFSNHHTDINIHLILLLLLIYIEQKKLDLDCSQVLYF